MAWVTPKTDWVSSDYYNFADLNRVENNANEIAALIATFTNPITLDSVNTSRDNTSIEFYDSLNRIENNILAFAIYLPLVWVTPKTNWASLSNFDYSDANRLEGNLLALYNMINNIIAEFRYCGQFGGAYYAGQDCTYL